jgi:hypothetical protein
VDVLGLQQFALCGVLAGRSRLHIQFHVVHFIVSLEMVV